MLILGAGTVIFRFVRKHRAPKGALRQVALIDHEDICVVSQKGPSAKKCIKTNRTVVCCVDRDRASESTERQKVH